MLAVQRNGQDSRASTSGCPAYSSSLVFSSSPLRSSDADLEFDRSSNDGNDEPRRAPPFATSIARHECRVITPGLTSTKSSSHRGAYKATTSARSAASRSPSAGPSSPLPSSPSLGSGSRWHSQFVQQCTSRAKTQRASAVNARRNGMEGDIVRREQGESREELAILRKMAMADKARTEQEVHADLSSDDLFHRASHFDNSLRTAPVMSDDQILRLAQLEAGLLEEEEEEIRMAQYRAGQPYDEDPPLDAILELDEDVLAEQYEEYQRSQHRQAPSLSDPYADAGRRKETFENGGGGMDVDPPANRQYGPSDAEEDEYGMDDSALYELIAQEEEERAWHG